MLGNLGIVHLLIVLLVIASVVLAIWAIVVMVRDTTVPAIATALWALVMFLIPGVGLIAWAAWWFTRKSRTTTDVS
ncbi:MAG: PLDc N-terminal domain-containing protein [Rhodoglobus sp.]